MTKRTSTQLFVLAILITLLMFFTWSYRNEHNIRYKNLNNAPLHDTYRIVAFGDSLIEGTGALPGYDFISLLEERLGVPILNLGRKGDTTYSALFRVAYMLSFDPEVVIISLGGNDVLRGVDVDKRLRNLQIITDSIQDTGAKIVLLGIRTGIIQDSHEETIANFAERNNIIYVPDVLAGILFNPGKLSDPVHPNNKGHELMADRIEPILRELLE